MQFSERISRISVSSTAAVVMKAEKLKASGVALIDFGAGEPDFPTPDNIKKAAVDALDENFTKYTPTGGTMELRKAVAERHARDFGSRYAPEECLITVGGKHAIFEAVAATINHGDEVILPVPYWVSFLDIINYAGGKAVLLSTREDQNFTVTAAAVEKLITPKTRLVIINSPCNPSGGVVSPAEMQKILALASRHNFLMMSDECYCHFVYEPNRPYSIGVTGNKEHLVIVGSLSKTYAMTGWRQGFTLGHTQLISNMLKLQSHSTSNSTSIAQKAALEALRGPQDSVQMMLAEYRRRRDAMVSGLRAIPRVQCTMPDGAFYAYPNISAYLGKDGMTDTTSLANRLLDEARVAVVPGAAFGTSEHLRLSYATSLHQIEEGLRRMKNYFAKLSPHDQIGSPSPALTGV